MRQEEGGSMRGIEDEPSILLKLPRDLGHVLAGEEEGGAEGDEGGDQAPGACFDQGPEGGLARDLQGGGHRVHFHLQADG